ncbi:YaaA family protein [Actinotalea sp.]|uniref:YaaA family protein n=1 Tax=Actinotalea sp. TaxID=1872145 RepID=UPI00356A4597
MLVLLPPSEGKTSPLRGRPVDLDGLSHPGLSETRRGVLDALVEVCAGAEAPALLGVGPSLADEVRRNTRLRSAPSAPARRVYSGVLYAAAGLDDLSGTALRRAQRTVRTVSALWGLVAPQDRIPAYRLSMGTALPGVGPLARYWRGPLAEEMALPHVTANGPLVVDARSSDYLAAWRPAGTDWDHVAVRVLRDDGDRLTVVSHEAKFTRGLLVGHLLSRESSPPRTAEDLASAAAEVTGVVGVELSGPHGRRVLSLVTRPAER